jgi:hypothetical protein
MKLAADEAPLVLCAFAMELVADEEEEAEAATWADFPS